MMVVKLYKHYIFLFICFCCTVLSMQAQKKSSSVSIETKATVIDKSEIELVTIKDMDIDISKATNGFIYISAKQDPAAAIMMVKGKENAKFRVSFLSNVEVRNRTGSGSMKVFFELRGYKTENQSASEPIDAVERILTMGEDGKYFFWIGGKLDISKARQGVYDGEFTIEIEYI